MNLKENLAQGCGARDCNPNHLDRDWFNHQNQIRADEQKADLQICGDV